MDEQCPAKPAPLPIIGDGRGYLSHACLAWNLDVADDRDRTTGARIDGEDRLVAVVVDVDQEVEFSLRQVRLRGGEAQVTRLVGKVTNGGRQACAIASLEGPCVDDAAVAQPQAPGSAADGSGADLARRGTQRAG